MALRRVSRIGRGRGERRNLPARALYPCDPGFTGRATVDWTYGHAASGKPLRLRIEPLAGIRYTNLRVELDGSGPRGNGRQVDESESWVDPIVGSRFILDLAESWTLSGEADIGGFGVGSDLAWNVQAFLGYKTSLAGRPLTLAAGYRALSQDYENGDFAWDVTTQGPILGVVMRF